MSSLDFIQKRLAFFLLVVFAVSITPKAYFHDALTRHTDEPVCKDKDKSAPHFHRPVFHCSFDDLVVSTPFLTVEHGAIADQQTFYTVYSTGYPSAIPFSPLFHTEGRGPPLI